MPIAKHPRAVDPLWFEWDRKAQKCGLRHQVYAVNGDCYMGEWLDNLKHGKGIQTWKKTGAIYQGDWKDGKRDGYGVYSLLDPVTGKYKRMYSGWWKNDQKCGYGIQFCHGQEYYEGEWEAGQRSGWGRMYYGNGNIYEGEWLLDRQDGQGMLRLGESAMLDARGLSHPLPQIIHSYLLSAYCVHSTVLNTRESTLGKERGLVERAWAWESEVVGSNPCSASCQLCDFGQVTSLLWASVPSSRKWRLRLRAPHGIT
uniref:MORN repeat-containing protein 3 n=1 Tax=Ornithorhynchus anatinus TaxID=9258 RepID=F6Q0E9_ORNAN